MTENANTQQPAELAVTVTFNVEDVLRAGVGHYYDPDTDEEGTTGQLVNAMIAQGAQRILNQHRYDTDGRIRQAIHEATVQHVADAISSGEIILTSGRSGTLRELVLEAAKAWPNARTDSYGDRGTNLQKLIAEVIKNELAKELRPVIDAAKAQIVGAIQAQASDMILKAAAELNKTIGGR